MNKLNLLLLAGAAALTGCASEDVINSGDINPPTGGQAMSFGMLTGNMSRAGMEADGHKDFGVFAYKGTDMAAGLVMDNYWVKYAASADDDGSNTTWGDASNLEDGLSKWYYEGVSGHKQNGTAQTQVLKYWDYSFANHYFVAYTPYNDAASARTLLEAKSTEGGYTELKSDLHILGANSFWTMADRDDNEAMWAKTTVAKADYSKDVALTFNHLNAVVRLAFRSNIPGYTVKIKNLTGTNPGVQLTPATVAQASAPIHWTPWTPTGSEATTQPEITQEYANKVTFTIADVFSSTAVPTTTVSSKAMHNLIFALDDTDNGVTELPIPSVPGGNTDYKPLNSQFFALPLTNADAYTGTLETGYTLHVTYELIPNDHAATTTVHDARVFIPADKCQWAYGKLYLYRFTITTASSGVTDPETPIYDDGTTNSPYVDIRDPRVPTDKALLPIVFDGVTVKDYTTVADSDREIN